MSSSPTPTQTRLNSLQPPTVTSEFRLPGAEDRTTIIGPTGSGKTVLGAWVLSKQRFDERPWVLMDFKGEILWDDIGDPPLRELKLGSMPGKRGLYRLRVNPGQEDELERWLWRIWQRENVGLFCDEVSLIQSKAAFKAILRQGRSKRIPVIACTQRPVDVDREMFTESQFISVFGLEDLQDVKRVKEFTRNAPVERPLRPHWSYWYDRKKFTLTVLKPVPEPAMIIKALKQNAPYSWWLG